MLLDGGVVQNMRREKDKRVPKNEKMEELWNLIDMAFLIILFIFTVLMGLVRAFLRECVSKVKFKKKS